MLKLYNLSCKNLVVKNLSCTNLDYWFKASQVILVVKNPPANARDRLLIHSVNFYLWWEIMIMFPFLRTWILSNFWSNVCREYIGFCIFLKIIYSFIYVWLLGLCCYKGFSLVAASGSYSLVTVCGLFTAVSFLVAEHWL